MGVLEKQLGNFMDVIKYITELRAERLGAREQFSRFSAWHRGKRRPAAEMVG